MSEHFSLPILTASLRGAPMSILFSLMMNRGPLSRDGLELWTGYSRRPVRDGLGVLLKAGLLVLDEVNKTYWLSDLAIEELRDAGFQMSPDGVPHARMVAARPAAAANAAAKGAQRAQNMAEAAISSDASQDDAIANGYEAGSHSAKKGAEDVRNVAEVATEGDAPEDHAIAVLSDIAALYAAKRAKDAQNVAEVATEGDAPEDDAIAVLSGIAALYAAKRAKDAQNVAEVATEGNAPEDDVIAVLSDIEALYAAKRAKDAQNVAEVAIGDDAVTDEEVAENARIHADCDQNGAENVQDGANFAQKVAKVAPSRARARVITTTTTRSSDQGEVVVVASPQAPQARASPPAGEQADEPGANGQPAAPGAPDEPPSRSVSNRAPSGLTEAERQDWQTISYWLKRGGVGIWSQKYQELMDKGLDPDAVRAHVLEREAAIKAGNGAKFTSGLLIMKLLSGDPPPLMRCEDCLQVPGKLGMCACELAALVKR